MRRKSLMQMQMQGLEHREHHCCAPALRPRKHTLKWNFYVIIFDRPAPAPWTAAEFFEIHSPHAATPYAPQIICPINCNSEIAGTYGLGKLIRKGKVRIL